MMKLAKLISAVEHSAAPDDAKTEDGWNTRLCILDTMLVLTLVGIGLTQASESGTWEC